MQLGFLPENAGFGSMVTESLLWYGWWKKSCISWYDKKSHYLQGFKHPRWCRMSSINSIDHGMSSFMLFTPASWFNAGSTLVTAENQGSTCSQPSFCLWFFSGDLANQSICQMICFAFILDTEITKKWGRKLCLKPTKAPFSIRRRSKISRNSWPLAVRCCSFRGARCCGFFHRTTGGPWCSKFLRPALTLAMKKSRMLYRLKFWQWMREGEKWLFGNLSVAGLAKNWKLRVRIYPCTIHRHCFCPIFPPENCRSHLDNSRVCLTSWERELVHLHPKCWWMSTAMTRPILLKLFRVKDFTHTWDLNATKTAGMAGTLLQGQRPWSLGILRFWTTKSLEKLLGDSSTEAWKLLFNETLVEIPLEP